MSSSFAIRPFKPTDLVALYDVCLLTGDNGKDATHHFDDRYLVGHIYAAPYAWHEPDLCFVLTCDDRPVGYVLGTKDSAAFHTWCEEIWFPPLRAANPLPPASDQSENAKMIRLLHRGHPVHPTLHEAYPAHLHIDLLPIGQGAGWGRKIMTTFLNAIRETGVAGVQLGVGINNKNAIGFYERMGFTALERHPWGIIFGMQLN